MDDCNIISYLFHSGHMQRITHNVVDWITNVYSN